VSQPPGPRAWPVDLDYPEAVPPALAMAAIVARGRRLRRARRLSAALAGLAACCALAGTGAVGRAALAGLLRSPPPVPAGVALVDSLVAASPPVTGKLSVISRWPGHWITVAWASRSGSVCWASYRIPMRGGSDAYECPEWVSADVPSAGPARAAGPAGFGPLLPMAEPGEVRSAHGLLVSEIGLVTAEAAAVTVAFRGGLYHAPVVRVPLAGGRSVGIYVIWLRLPPGVTSPDSTKITGLTGYDRAGQVVAMQP
jgi:hypothetical protein